jgi:acyl-[acyl-carrier-protein]-phospholipid O-acyltransferase/long-chain-fatty-acid--[acyl-carrier-protein] ligase
MKKPFPIKLRPRVRLTYLPTTVLPMPEARSAKLRRKLAGENLRLIMQRAVMDARPKRTLYDALLGAIPQRLHDPGDGLLR